MLLLLALLAPALLAASAGAGAGAASAAADVPCPGFQLVPGQGPSCPVEGGWEVLLLDGSRVRTHGPDAMPSGVTGPYQFPPPVPPACVDDPLTQFHGVLVYAHPRDRPDRSAQLADEMRRMLGAANAHLRMEAAEHGATLDYRMRCAGGEAEIVVAHLAAPTGVATFQTITSELKAQGLASPMAKYWVWYDGWVDCGCGGQGTLDSDGRPLASNRNNMGPSYGVTYGYTGFWGAFVMMHENGHNLGAVHNGAPNTSGGHHCNDGYDVMCYADGGPQSAYTTSACTDRHHFDCGHDDYFHPRAPKGSFLARSWNLAHPYNAFLQGCQYETGVLGAGAMGVHAEGATSVTHALDAGCPAGAKAAVGLVDAAKQVQLCALSGETPLACRIGLGGAEMDVPAGATHLRATARIGVPGTYYLNVV